MSGTNDFLRLGLWPTPFNLYAAVGGKQLKRLSKHFGFDPEDMSTGDAAVLGHTRMREDGNVVVWLSDEAVTRPLWHLANTCAHESLHVVNFLTDHIGETEKTLEIECYWVGFITGHLFDHARKRRAKLRG